MNAVDSQYILELLRDVHLAAAVAVYEGDNQLVVDYSDMKPHRNGEPRTQMRHIEALYALQQARGGVTYSMSTAVSPYDGLQRLTFTKLEVAEARHG